MRAGAVAVLALVMLAGACSGRDGDPSAAEPGASPSPTVKTLTPIPLPPPPPPSGKLVADIQQSSRDAAADRFEVWVDNDTEDTITPMSVIYDDDRFPGAQVGTRLRDIPSQARRGFQFVEPDRPACGSEATSGTVTVVYRVGDETRTQTVPVDDEADVVARVAASTCLERGVARVAELRFADDVPVIGVAGKGSHATLTLVVTPTGRSGGTLTIDSIAGNPVLSPVGTNGFEPGLTITGTQAPQRVPLELKPTRCDAHAFGESGSLASFAVNVHLDGEPGQIILRLSPAGATNAISFAKASCGELTGL